MKGQSINFKVPTIKRPLYSEAVLGLLPSFRIRICVLAQ